MSEVSDGMGVEVYQQLQERMKQDHFTPDGQWACFS